MKPEYETLTPPGFLASALPVVAAAVLAGAAISTQAQQRAEQAGAKRNFAPATRRTPAIARYQELGLGIWFGAGVNANTAVQQYDVERWARLLKGAGVKYGPLVVKGNGGWCLWDSAYTEYDIASSKNKPGVVRQFLDACRKHGIATGLSYCLAKDADGFHGRKMTDEEYYTFANNQLRELLTHYGRIDLMWIEAARPPDRMQQAYNTIKSLQPHCLVIGHGGNYNPRQLQNVADVFQPSDHLPPPGDTPWRIYRGKKYYIPWETFILFRGGGGDPVSPSPEICAALFHEIRKRGANALIMWFVTGPLDEKTFGRYFEKVAALRKELEEAEKRRRARGKSQRSGEFIEAAGPFVHDYIQPDQKYVYHWTRTDDQRKIGTQYRAIWAAEKALLAKLNKWRTKDGTLLGKAIRANPQLWTLIHRETKAAQIVHVQWDKKGGCRVTLRVYQDWIEKLLREKRP